MPAHVDWSLARQTALAVIPAGPNVTARQASLVVEQVREASLAAQAHVERVSGLVTSTPLPATVVSRQQWAEINVEGMSQVINPLIARAMGGSSPSAAAARTAGVQAGALLGYMSTKVLGQYEIFGGEGAGTLLVVAPNLVAAERRLGVDPTDFRLWVCVHEATHRAQFTAVPWLRETLIDLAGDYARASGLALADVPARLAAATRAARAGGSIMESAQSPAQREILDRITGMMSLIEGHAEWVMDAVGADVVPSVGQLRAAIDMRREGTGPVDRWLRAVLGLSAKMRQYARGRVFVEAVVAAVGVDGLNRAWSSAQTLPTSEEIERPGLWLERVTA
jgi:coenzyme F420 biosynthesis associated uncharacterized protein